jgi:REP element-mobilizing transposase RayT
MNRGNHRDNIFYNDKDRELFLKTLNEARERTGWQVHDYCLVRNHFHLVVETPRPNLSLGMQWLLGTYTARFNRRRKLFGHLFSGRYKSLLVDGRQWLSESSLRLGPPARVRRAKGNPLDQRDAQIQALGHRGPDPSAQRRSGQSKDGTTPAV